MDSSSAGYAGDWPQEPFVVTQGLDHFSAKLSAEEDPEKGEAFQILRRTLMRSKQDRASLQTISRSRLLEVLHFLAEGPERRRNQTKECLQIILPEFREDVLRSSPDILRKLRSVFLADDDLQPWLDPTGDAKRQAELESNWSDVGSGGISNKNDFLDLHGTVINKVAGPDAYKLSEVEAMERRHGKSFPCLSKRFRQGRASEDPDEILALVKETVDYMLTPINALVPETYIDCMGEITGSHAKRHAIVLVGMTGSGKSTVGNFLVGRALSKVDQTPDNEEDDDVKIINIEDPIFKVGHDPKASQTFAPTIKEIDDKLVVIDFPGFLDTNGMEIRIGMDLAFRELCERLAPVHVLALLPIDSFAAGRGAMVKQQVSKLKRLLPTRGAPIGAGKVATGEHACVWEVGVTKCDKDFIINPKKAFREAVELVASIDEKLAPRVININETMFCRDPASARQELLRRLTKEAMTPVVQQHEMTGIVKKAFGVARGSIMTDCLNPNDTTWFAKAFMTDRFAQSFVETDRHHSNCIRNSVNVEDAAEQSWQRFSKEISDQVAVLTAYAQGITSDSQELIRHGTLSLERRNKAIQFLCKYQQCRLKSCFVQAEEAIMMANLMNISELLDHMWKEAQELWDNGFLRRDDFVKLEAAKKETLSILEANAMSLGFAGIGDLVTTVGRAASGCAMVGGAGALVYVAANSVTVWPWLAGTGALGSGAALTLSSGGVALVAGAVGFALFHSIKKHVFEVGNKYSSEITASILEAFQALGDASTAATAHKKAMAAIKETLRQLEIPLED